MKKSVLLFIAFIMCGLISNAQKKENFVSLYEQKKAQFATKNEVVEPSIKTFKQKDFIAPKYEELLLDSIYFYFMPTEELDTKWYYAYDQFGNESEFIYLYLDENTQTWFTNQAYTYTYDSHGNLLEYSYLGYSDNIVSYGEKTISEFDENKNKTLNINIQWSTENNDWLNSEKYTYEYNQNQDVTLEEAFYWNSEWISNYKKVYTYNPDGQLSEANEFIWDFETSSWILNLKQINTYNENNILISTNFFDLDYNTSELIETTRITYTLYDNDLPSDMLTQTWDYENLTLKNFENEHYTYNEFNLLFEKYYYLWNSNLSDWTAVIYYTFNYDSELRLNEKSTYVYDGTSWNLSFTETWLYDSQDRLLDNTILSDGYTQKLLYAYDEFDNKVLEAVQYLAGEVWENSYIFESDYDENNNILFESNIDYNYNYGDKTEYTYVDNLLSETLKYDWSNEWIVSGHDIYSYDENDILSEVLSQYWDNAWVDFSRKDYYFSLHEVIAEIKNHSNLDVTIYPNPTSDILMLNNISKNAVISIFDISGKQVINQVNLNNQININYLTNGIYVLKITDNSETKTLKFVKE